MVNITYKNGLDSNEQDKFILKEVHFYISDKRCHNLTYVHHYFQLNYDHLKVITYRWINIGVGMMGAWASSITPMYSNGCA